MNPDERIQLLDKLKDLLQRQIQMAKQANDDAVDDLAEQADAIVKEISRMRFLEMPEFAERRIQIRQLYDALRIAVTARSADVARRLNLVRRGKKTVGKYRSNIP